MQVKTLFKNKTARLCVGAFLIGNLALATVTWASFDRAQSKAVQIKKRDTNGPFAPNKGKLGQQLFIAVGRRDLEQVKSLLKQGADPNSENALTFSPLFMAAASYQMDVMEELIKAGAEPDYDSSYGTALSFAAGSGNAAGMQILLFHGADPTVPRNDGMTPLMMAAVSGAPPAVEVLLKQKIDVNTQDDHGATALNYAARGGHDAAAQMLLGAGAKVDLADNAKQTPLMIAASAGKTEVVKLLLAKGANPNAKDANGKTALILASAFGDYPEVVAALKAAGANPKVADSSGRTPAYYATARGHAKCAELLGKPAPTSMTKLPTASSPKTAVLMSLKVVQASMNKFNKSTACISCHHEGLGRIATGAAQQAGFKIDPVLEQALSGRVNGAMEAMKPLHDGALKNPQMMLQVPLIEINEVTSGDTWLLMGRAAHNPKPDAGASAMAMVVAKMQSPDGSWTYGAPREPMESSYFTYTALAARSLKYFAPKSAEKEITERFQLAQHWLVTTPTKNSEDRASKLLGLKWTGASADEIKKAAEAIIADQRPDGGWAQLDNLSSDAYATGQALYALHESGAVPVKSETYQKGVKYLLRTQQEDGSWFVNKRAFPGNNHFEAGFPYGKSQFSSFNGTCWAMMALLPATSAK